MSGANMHSSDLHPRSMMLSCAALATVMAGAFSSIGAADDRLLKETVEFTGAMTFLGH
jgi:hypothetical protein